MLPEGLKSREAASNKHLLVVLALRYQGPSLISGSERKDAAYIWEVIGEDTLLHYRGSPQLDTLGVFYLH